MPVAMKTTYVDSSLVLGTYLCAVTESSLACTLLKEQMLTAFLLGSRAEFHFTV